MENAKPQTAMNNEIPKEVQENIEANAAIFAFVFDGQREYVNGDRHEGFSEGGKYGYSLSQEQLQAQSKEILDLKTEWEICDTCKGKNSMCTDCYGQGRIGNQSQIQYYKQQCESMSKEIEALKAEKWISVKERLPKDGADVLTATLYTGNVDKPNQRFTICNAYSKTLKRWDFPEDQNYEKVTHWQPLPPPPKI